MTEIYLVGEANPYSINPDDAHALLPYPAGSAGACLFNVLSPYEPCVDETGKWFAESSQAVALLPHPSGRSRLWQAAGSHARARDAVELVRHCFGDACTPRAYRGVFRSYRERSLARFAPCACFCGGCRQDMLAQLRGES